MKRNPTAGPAAFLRRYGVTLLLTAAVFAVTYTAVYRGRLDFLGNDYAEHTFWAMKLNGSKVLATFYNGRGRLWHILVWLLSKAGISNLWVPPAIVTGAANAAAYFICCRFWDRVRPGSVPSWAMDGLMLCVFLVSSLTLPGHSFYTGRGAVNTWHNPTNIMVRPFAAAVFYMTVDIYDRRRWGQHTILPDPAVGMGPFSFAGGFWSEFRVPVFTWQELILYPLCLILSAYAKPSFLQFFAPAIFLFLLFDVVRTRGKLLPFCIKLALAFIPAALIICRQYLHYFGGGITFSAPVTDVAAAGGILSAAPAAAVSRSSLLIYFIAPSFTGPGNFLARLWAAFRQTLYPCAFPLFILLISCRRPKGAAGRLGLTCLIVGRLEHLCIHETGSRAGHGNFSWGYFLSVWLLWTFAIGIYARLLREKSTAGRLARWGGSALLIWHVTCGVSYLIHIFQTAEFLC